MSNLTDTFNLKCPNCGQAERLEIAITGQADVTTDEIILLGDRTTNTAWRDQSID
jgi:sarcosine oxidase delta subunit